MPVSTNREQSSVAFRALKEGFDEGWECNPIPFNRQYEINQDDMVMTKCPVEVENM